MMKRIMKSTMVFAIENWRKTFSSVARDARRLAIERIALLEIREKKVG